MLMRPRRFVSSKSGSLSSVNNGGVGELSVVKILVPTNSGAPPFVLSLRFVNGTRDGMFL